MGNESKNKKKNDNKLDIVKESFENGLTYEGEETDGEWNGLGTLKSPDGFCYEGQFKRGKFKGTSLSRNSIETKCKQYLERGESFYCAEGAFPGTSTET